VLFLLWSLDLTMQPSFTTLRFHPTYQHRLQNPAHCRICHNPNIIVINLSGARFPTYRQLILCLHSRHMRHVHLLRNYRYQADQIPETPTRDGLLQKNRSGEISRFYICNCTYYVIRSCCLSFYFMYTSICSLHVYQISHISYGVN